MRPKPHHGQIWPGLTVTTVDRPAFFLDTAFLLSVILLGIRISKMAQKCRKNGKKQAGAWYSQVKQGRFMVETGVATA
jgi:hypothetical protein